MNSLTSLSPEDPFQLIVRSDFHRFALAEVCQASLWLPALCAQIFAARQVIGVAHIAVRGCTLSVKSTAF